MITKNGRILLKEGKNGALLVVCDTATKYEIVSAWGYDKESDSWGQGHYFTLWYDEITEENKAKLLEKATKHFVKHYA